MKTLIIVGHPDLSQSVINKRWVTELRKYPEKFVIHELAKVYPGGKIDIKKEQALVEQHDQLVFQFPIYWFSCPPIVKQWFDEVLTHGWAYGREIGDKLLNRKIALAISTGIKKEDYHKNGRYHHTLNEVLVPFEMTLKHYCHADYQPFFAFYGAEATPGKEYASTNGEIEKSATDYLHFLTALSQP